MDLKAAHERYLEEAAKVFIGEKKAEDAEYFKRYLKRLAKDVGVRSSLVVSSCLFT